MPSHNGSTPTFVYFEPGAPLDISRYLEQAHKEHAEAKARRGTKAAPRPAISGTDNAFTRAADAEGMTERSSIKYRTPWLAKALALFGRRILVADLVLDVCEEAQRRDEDKSVIACCPNGAGHTDGFTKGDDLLAINGADTTDTKGMFALSCFHNSCSPLGAGQMLDHVVQCSGMTMEAFINKYVAE